MRACKFNLREAVVHLDHFWHISSPKCSTSHQGMIGHLSARTHNEKNQDRPGPFSNAHDGQPWLFQQGVQEEG